MTKPMIARCGKGKSHWYNRESEMKIYRIPACAKESNRGWHIKELLEASPTLECKHCQRILAKEPSHER